MKRKRKKIVVSILVALGVAVMIFIGILVSVKQNLLNYGAVEFSYGKVDDAVFYEFTSRDRADVNINTLVTVNQRDKEGKVIKSKMYIWVGRQAKSSEEETTNYFKEIMRNEQTTIEWVFIFKDKVITIINGEIKM